MNREEVFLSNPPHNAPDPNRDPYGNLERLELESFGEDAAYGFYRLAPGTVATHCTTQPITPTPHYHFSSFCGIIITPVDNVPFLSHLMYYCKIKGRN